MELERCDFRAIMYYDFDSGLTQEGCFLRYLALLRHQGQPFSRWFAEFRMGRESFQDDPHPRRPKTAVLPETITAEEEMLK